MLDRNKIYTYADYLALDDDVVLEVINGEVINMSPPPTPKHQDVVDELTAEFKMFLRDKECRAFSSPMDVCLFADEGTKAADIQNWVQPDLMVICDSTKIKDNNIIGAPDLIVEVLSPSTARNDRWIKLKSYEEAGVKEYWIVDPYNMSVEVYIVDRHAFKQTKVFGKDDDLTGEIFTELKIDLKNIFKS
ncbi:Uma2 family endonuclease [Lentibacillus sp. CBA3610]|uniref:Uma2 family endonuclease n=1 Tax=Lentibacillus sp. CBA3610 TaxID=2518176 RepID=UPI001595C6F9|nr:Uma2 family endonuclease [Lentibacillus sp. CBA3610]QKY68641.1 Uma2 family endonuclease [Lentibacillus sp. CBA3610]